MGEAAFAVGLEEWTRGFLPRDWTGGEGSVLVVLFRSVRAPLDRVGVGPLGCGIGPVRACLFWGAPMVPKASSEFWFVEPDQMGWTCNLDGDVALQEGRYCMLCARFTDPESKADARASIDAARGLLYAYHGRNVAYMKVSELEVALASPTLTQSTETAENPFCLPAPKLSPAEFRAFSVVAQRIDEVDAPERDRLGLSFRWFTSATHLWGPDAFLHYWIALEALAMPDSTNIRPVNEHLAASYGVSLAEATTEFKVGRLYGIRSAIVHEGSHRPVPGDVLTYLAALYSDVLLDVLALPSEGRARSAWASTGDAVGRFLGQSGGT